MDDYEPALEEDEPRGAGKPICACLTLLILLCVGWGIAYASYGYEIRVNATAFETRLTMEVMGDDVDLGEVCQVLRERFKTRDVLAKVEATKDGLIEISLLTTDREFFKPLLKGGAVLRFFVDVDESEVTPAERKIEVKRIRFEQESGAWDLSVDRYASYPWDSTAQQASPTQLLLRTEGRLEGDDFASFSLAMEANSRPCVAFTMTPDGGKKLFELTSNNVKRKLAIVLNDKVLSAPVIRSGIGERGIIEMPGQTSEELDELLTQLNSGTLPYELILVKEEQIRGSR
ncbi:MAG: hypothetical protein JKY65_30505 [Planctomycetes bacterium]|nr:hypothetical protein [Planctomycetota bacterium]